MIELNPVLGGDCYVSNPTHELVSRLIVVRTVLILLSEPCVSSPSLSSLLSLPLFLSFLFFSPPQRVGSRLVVDLAVTSSSSTLSFL